MALVNVKNFENFRSEKGVSGKVAAKEFFRHPLLSLEYFREKSFANALVARLDRSGGMHYRVTEDARKRALFLFGSSAREIRLNTIDKTVREFNTPVEMPKNLVAQLAEIAGYMGKKSV